VQIPFKGIGWKDESLSGFSVRESASAGSRGFISVAEGQKSAVFRNSYIEERI
jgi:hypothetical protein